MGSISCIDCGVLKSRHAACIDGLLLAHGSILVCGCNYGSVSQLLVVSHLGFVVAAVNNVSVGTGQTVSL